MLQQLFTHMPLCCVLSSNPDSRDMVADMINGVSRVVQRPMTWGSDGSANEKAMRQYLITLLELDTIYTLMSACAKTLAADVAECQLPIKVVTSLVLNSPALCQQLVRCFNELEDEMRNFLGIVLNWHSEQPKLAAEMLYDIVSLFAQIARISVGNYTLLQNFGVLEMLVALLAGSSLKVTGQLCSALGNMFRHSDFFYLQFESIPRACDLLKACVTREDATTAKYACFALGNLSFHSDMFYEQLSRAIGPLLQVVEGGDGSTAGNSSMWVAARSNATGVLGNLARNSGCLDPELALHRAPQRILAVAVSHSDNTRLLDTCLHTLGTLAKRTRCNTALSTPDVLATLRALQQSGQTRNKQLLRLLSKLDHRSV